MQKESTQLDNYEESYEPDKQQRSKLSKEENSHYSRWLCRIL